MNDETKKAFEHAWKYFEIHTNQRMTVFNFYIAIIGLLAAGSGICIQQGYELLTSVMGMLISLISFLFYKLDERVSILIKRAENVLEEIEGGFERPTLMIFKSDSNDLNLNKSFLSPWTYGKCFRVSFFMIFNIGLLIIIFPTFKLYH